MSSAGLLERLDSRVQTRPEAIALRQGERVTTYADLWREACGIATRLRELRTGTGARVVLALSAARCAAATYACWMANAVAVPVDAQARPRELRNVIDHSEAAVVLHEGPLASGSPDAAPSMDVVATAVPADDPSRPMREAPQGLAMLLYTSGSSGRPKGVMLSHESLAANTAAIVERLSLDATDRVATALPFHYSYGSSVLHSHLWAGGAIVHLPNMVFPRLALQAIAREQATGFAGVAATYALLLWRADADMRALRSLRYLTHAGGPMSAGLRARIREAFPQASLHVMYGQTEATARLTCLPPAMLDVKPGSVGTPLPGVVLEIRDDAGHPLAAGTSGEICVRGPNVMLGYWRDSESTAAVLRDGWLHTGDLGFVDEDGHLTVTGRRNEMIKSGAHRIHPEEVEEVLLELPGLSEAAVVGAADELLGEVVSAVLVRRPGVVLTEDDVRLHCRARLAAHKIPRHVRFVTELPRGGTGKVLRAELRVAEITR